jgi:hypothetical protein
MSQIVTQGPTQYSKLRNFDPSVFLESHLLVWLIFVPALFYCIVVSARLVVDRPSSAAHFGTWVISAAPQDFFYLALSFDDPGLSRVGAVSFIPSAATLPAVTKANDESRVHPPIEQKYVSWRSSIRPIIVASSDTYEGSRSDMSVELGRTA